MIPSPLHRLRLGAEPSLGWAVAQSAACLDPSRGVCAVHLVNNGASRPVTLAGLPASVARMTVYVTDARRGLEKLEPVTVKNGSAQFTLPGQSLTTLINDTIPTR